MKELRAVLLLGAVVVVMMVSANPGKVRDKRNQSNLLKDETEMNNTDPIEGIESDRMSGRVCCKSRHCKGCLCRRTNPRSQRSLIYEERIYEHTKLLEQWKSEEDGVPGEEDGVPGKVDGVPSEQKSVPGEEDYVPGEEDYVPGEEDYVPGGGDSLLPTMDCAVCQETRCQKKNPPRG